MSNKDDFGDRMKLYEGIEAGRKLMPLLPIVARIDGKTFSTFCKGLERPYDERLSQLMQATTVFLMEKTGALVGYTQSDEISLLWYADDYKSQTFLNGRVTKLVSVLAGWASAYFTRHLPSYIPEKGHVVPCFDARVWNVPNREEAANCFLWREKDATKNSISMAARAHFSHKSLMNMSGKEMQERLFQEAGINWNGYPAFFKRGSFYIRRTDERPFTAEEIERLPAKHEARRNPDLVITRQRIVNPDMPPFTKVTNRVEVLFEGANPETATAEEAL